ncbi:DUF1810 domain-containing protein [Flavobacterium sp. fv08]|uniref:DUF1810 domain-containing protein n=1 Tax=Flavobacterium sp. fv08 TaxID=1761784 RepID=UPI0008B0E08E|nr:DUF1810 family protein [Flavobacterium sp. fv08]SEP05896.1 Uncharacterized protein, DUF1810 family [Flavobacterium sp. fv08]
MERFVKAHELFFDIALQEIHRGKKETHWMWFIFPQLRGLSHSEISNFYALKDLNEALIFLTHPVLGRNFKRICNELLDRDNQAASDIFGYPDVLKFHSSLTLFSIATQGDILFSQLLDKYFNAELDQKTLILLDT